MTCTGCLYESVARVASIRSSTWPLLSAAPASGDTLICLLPRIRAPFFLAARSSAASRLRKPAAPCAGIRRISIRACPLPNLAITSGAYTAARRARVAPHGCRCYHEFGAQQIARPGPIRAVAGRIPARVQGGAHHRIAGDNRIAIDLASDPCGALRADRVCSGDGGARLGVGMVFPAVTAEGKGERTDGRHDQHHCDQDGKSLTPPGGALPVRPPLYPEPRSGGQYSRP